MRMINNVMVVDMGQFALLDAHDDARYMVTRFTSDCTGLALICEDKSISALMHVASSRYFIHANEDAVKAHADNLWQEVAAALERKNPTAKNFTATAFGVMAARTTWEEARRHGVGCASASVISSCLNRHFMRAASENIEIRLVQDKRMSGQSQSCIVDKLTGDMRVMPDRVYDPLIEAMTSRSRLYGTGTGFKSVITLERK